MYRRSLVRLSLLTMAAALSLFLLLRFASLPNQRPNGFKRIWMTTDPLTVSRQLTTTAPLEHICGNTDTHFFLTVQNPQCLIMVDSGFTRLDTICYGLGFNKNMLGANQTMVDSPWVYFFANNIPAIFRGRLDKPAIDTLYRPKNTFTRSAIIPPDILILRILDDNLKQQNFQKINIQTKHVEVSFDLFKDQKNGGFDTDGILKYDKSSGNLFYIENYRNRFYCFDSTLHMVYAATTIDTFHYNPVSMQLINIEGENRLTPGAARTLINSDCFLSNGKLLIASKVKADNETSSNFKNNKVIDVYDCKTGEYSGSFYVPLIKGEKIKSITCFGKQILVLYDNNLAMFRLPKNGRL